MDNFIRQRLNRFEQMAQQILCDVEGIFGYCTGMESVANDYHTTLQPLVEYGNQNKVTTLEEIQAMIVELHIKGSVRERSDGRFEYRSALLGSIYGFTKEEIEQKITQKLKEVKQNKGKPIGTK